MIYRVSTSEVELTIPSGQQQSSIVHVPATPSGHIVRVASTQTSGSNVSYTLFIFDTDTPDTSKPALNCIAGPFTVNSGATLLEYSQNRWYYVNRKSTAPNAGFYVRVTTGSPVSNTCTFKVVISWMTNEF